MALSTDVITAKARAVGQTVPSPSPYRKYGKMSRPPCKCVVVVFSCSVETSRLSTVDSDSMRAFSLSINPSAQLCKINYCTGEENSL